MIGQTLNGLMEVGFGIRIAVHLGRTAQQLDIILNALDLLIGQRPGFFKEAVATTAAAKSKRAKATPLKKSPAKPPPGRARRARAIEIDDSGDDDDEIPASVPASRSRRSTRAR